MKLTLVTIFLLLSNSAGAEILARTQDNRTVILHQNGTWEFQSKTNNYQNSHNIAQAVTGNSTSGATYKLLGTVINSKKMNTCVQAINNTKNKIVKLNLNRVICDDLGCSSFFDGSLIDGNTNNLDAKLNHGTHEFYGNKVSLYPNEQIEFSITSKQPVGGNNLLLKIDGLEIKFETRKWTSNTAEARAELDRRYKSYVCKTDAEIIEFVSTLAAEQKRETETRRSDLRKFYEEKANRWKKMCNDTNQFACDNYERILELIEKFR